MVFDHFYFKSIDVVEGFLGGQTPPFKSQGPWNIFSQLTPERHLLGDLGGKLTPLYPQKVTIFPKQTLFSLISAKSSNLCTF